ncbi:basic helix-loop-helix transcription factor [Lithospermum erythrorhizon]|uniref:Basic helix-loop-helix transcription factor n=1 Tax=Lithospermum erythrorhizon TaxID=34254 RepID=A0AAV3PJJ9_LITER
MDFSFDEINELLEFFPDTLRQDPLLLQGGQTPLPQPQELQQNTTSLTQPIHVQPHNTSNVASGSNTEDAKPSHSMTKISHRENERQRRKEMADLYRSLRSLLPLERIKGKRSSSDHIQETVGYIKELQSKIESLSLARDGMKNQSFDHTTTIGTENFPDLSQTSVTIRPTLTGFEVLMNTAFAGGVKISAALNIISQEGLSIVRCNSSRVDGRLLHSIETKVNEGMCIDPTELERKLRDYCAMGYSPRSSRGPFVRN